MDKGMNDVRKRLVRWLKEKAGEADAGGAVLGLSGGVDSSVVAALAKEAFGSNVLGIIMPCNSSGEDMEHAKMVAKKFGIETRTIDLGDIYGVLKGRLPPGNKLSDANIKPRLRMLSLYYFANLHNYIVLGTGNKTELMIGYFTKYGDGGVDLLPIAGLYKHQVRELARLLSVPDVIISKPPTAGLWPGQTDEGEIGMLYDELDVVLAAIEKNDTKGQDEAKLKKVMDMIKKSGHKRRLPEIFEP